MDRTYIESQQIVARYLSGDLTVREARQFEKYCLENPDWVKDQPIPMRLKAKMIRKPGEDLDTADLQNMPSNTAVEAAELDDDDDEDDDDRGATKGYGALPPVAQRWIRTLVILLVLAIGGAVGAALYANSLSNQMASMKKTAKEIRLRAIGSTREYRVKPTEAQPAAPTVSIGWPEQPFLIDLRVDVSDGGYSTYLVSINSVSEGRIMQIRRVGRDSNGELRISLNSSSFGPGDYDVKLEGYTWRGDTDRASWIRLGMK